MNILSMLARLEDALGCSDLAEKMVLLPQTRPFQAHDHQDINLVVGYDGSPRSQTALDLTLWIAHKTRMVSRRQVIVQVVYVVDLANECSQPPSVDYPPMASNFTGKSTERQQVVHTNQAATRHRSASAIAEFPELPVSELTVNSHSCQVSQFEQADQILWQARHLAEEWRGSLKTHLRFGDVAQELRAVVEAEAATLLLLGCSSATETMVQKLGQGFPCPVLGIPPAA